MTTQKTSGGQNALVMSPHSYTSHIWLQVSAQLLYLLSYFIISSFSHSTCIYYTRFFAFVQGCKLAVYSKGLWVGSCSSSKINEAMVRKHQDTMRAAKALFHPSNSMNASHPRLASARLAVSTYYKASADLEGQ